MTKKTKKEYKVGDRVKTFLRKSSQERILVSAEIKSIKNLFGKNLYLLTNGVALDFTVKESSLK